MIWPRMKMITFRHLIWGQKFSATNKSAEVLKNGSKDFLDFLHDVRVS